MSIVTEIERLERSATPEPWIHDIDPRTDGADQVVTPDGRTVAFMSRGRLASDPDQAYLDADAALIVLLRNHLPEIRAALALAGADLRIVDTYDANDIEGNKRAWADRERLIVEFRSTLPRSGGA